MSFDSLQYQGFVGFVEIDEIIVAGGWIPAACDTIQINIEYPASGGVNSGRETGNKREDHQVIIQQAIGIDPTLLQPWVDIASSRLSVLADEEQYGYEIGIPIINCPLCPELHAALSLIFN